MVSAKILQKVLNGWKKGNEGIINNCFGIRKKKIQKFRERIDFYSMYNYIYFTWPEFLWKIMSLVGDGQSIIIKKKVAQNLNFWKK